MEKDLRLPTEAMHGWVRQLWRNVGSCDREAQRIADHLIGANLAGHDSHGVGMVPAYVRSLQAGELKLNQRLTVVTDAEALTVVDGNRGIGQSMAFQAMELAAERAHRYGVAILGLRNSHHIGRVGHWAEQAMAEGLVSVHFTNVVGRPMVAPFGGIQARLGTNPITIGLPRRDGPSVLLDFASSAIALGKVSVAYNRKGEVAKGALIDHRGRPTTHPSVMYEEPLGALLSAAGHKGYALAMMCDLLGSALFGGAAMHPDRARMAGFYNNMLVILFDPRRFGTADAFEAEASRFIAYVQSAVRADPETPIELPGEYERRCREQRAEALPLDAGTVCKLDQAALAVQAMCGVALPPASALVRSRS